MPAAPRVAHKADGGGLGGGAGAGVVADPTVEVKKYEAIEQSPAARFVYLRTKKSNRRRQS